MEAYRRYGPALLRKCERMLGDRADAEDVVQALFADLLAKGARELDLPYLYRAVTHRCLNVLRDSRRRRELLAREGAVGPAQARGRLEDQVVSARLLARLCDLLSDDAAEVLVYHFCDDMTQDEIADLIGASRKTVGKRIARVREAARALAAPDAGGTP